MKEHPVIHLRTAQDADDYCAMIADRAAEHTGRPVSHKVVAGVLLAMTEVSEEAEVAGVFLDEEPSVPFLRRTHRQMLKDADGVDDVDQAQAYQSSVDKLSLRLSEVLNTLTDQKNRFESHAKLVLSDISSLDERVTTVDRYAASMRGSVEALLAWRNDWQTRYADVTAIRNEVSDLRDEVEYLSKEVQKGKVARWTES